MKHIVALSGGKDSTAMALRLQEVEQQNDYLFVCTPTGEESDEMFSHWRRLGDLLGKPIVPIATVSFEKATREQNSLPNWRMRWCTRLLKIEPFQALAYTHAPCTVYVGLRAVSLRLIGASYGEAGGEVYGAVADVTQRFPLREWGWGLTEVWEYLDARGIEIPERTDCECCFFQRLDEWWRLWRNKPERYARYEAMEERFGHTFRSDKRDTWPASLKGLREAFESGRVPLALNQTLTMRLGVESRKDMCRACRL